MANYKYVAYFEVIELFRSSGYEVCKIFDYNINWALYLRHDVDLDLKYAAEMAEEEAKKSLKSVYFIQLTSLFYNPLFKSSQIYIKRILDCGQEIGLHFNHAAYMGDEDRMIAIEKEVLELIIGKEIKTITIHRPREIDLGGPVNKNGMISLYSEKYFLDIEYMSDSYGKWTYGDPRIRIKEAKGRSFQLLTHPYIWRSPKIKVASKLKRFKNRKEIELLQELENNFKLYKKFV